MLFTIALSALAALLPQALALDGPNMFLSNGRFFGLNNDDHKFEMYRGTFDRAAVASGMFLNT